MALRAVAGGTGRVREGVRTQGGGGTPTPPPGGDLVLNFLTSTMDPSLTFTSTGGKTFTNSSGSTITAAANQPRLDYSGGTPLGLLIASDGTEDCYLGGSAFTAAYNATGWTLVIEWNQVGGANNSSLTDICDATPNELIAYYNGGGVGAVFLTPGDVARINSFQMVADNSINKIALSLNASGTALSLNGGTPLTGTGNAAVATADRLQIGSRRGYGYGVDGHIRKITLKNTMITGAALQALSA